MGCDIHFYVERRTPTGWEFVAPDDKADKFGYEYKHFYHDRNYRLFAALADVRNGFGFAGCKTGEPIEPISPTRGLPSDCTAWVRKEHKDWGSDAHSESWLTLAEIKAYNWDREVVITGVIEEEDYKKLKAGVLPREWWGSICGRNIAVIPANIYDELTDEQKSDRAFLMSNFATSSFHQPTPDEPICIKVQADWTRSLYSECKTFLEKTIPALSALGPAEDIRCVFWFDN